MWRSRCCTLHARPTDGRRRDTALEEQHFSRLFNDRVLTPGHHADIGCSGHTRSLACASLDTRSGNDYRLVQRVEYHRSVE